LKIKQIITKQVPTPIGDLLAGAMEQGVCLLEFADRPRVSRLKQRLSKTIHAKFVQGENSHLSLLEEQLSQYFEGKRKLFNLPLALQGTSFQMNVWEALLHIPYGSTRSYQAQARIIGKPKAVRAVGKANGDNPVSIVIPCHRVVGKNGNLTGYGGGLWRKRFLIDLEKGSI